MPACLRSAWRVAVAVVATGAASGKEIATGKEACNNEAGDCDDVGLLQAHRSLEPVGDSIAAKSARCVHGRASSRTGGHCVCFPGWGGSNCGVPEEAAKRGSDGPTTTGCGQGFTVYPYSQPELWATAYEGWEECAGKEQSPINIITLGCIVDTVQGRNISVSYKPTRGNYVFNTGHSIKVSNVFGTLRLRGKTYEAVQFHFHTPSEHTVNFLLSPAEMHIVHVAEDGALAVVGIFLNLGEENKCLKRVLQGPAPIAGCDDAIGPLDLNCFGEQLSGPWWSYDGSLTTPPCSEGVAWNVMQRPATLSKHQLDVLSSRFLGTNNRPVLPLNGRQITYHI